MKEVQRQDTFSEIISGLLLGKLDAELGSGGGRRAASPSAILGKPSEHFQNSLSLVHDSSQGKTASRLEGNEKGTDEKRWPAASEPIKTRSRFVIAAKIIFCTTAREIRSPTLSHPGSEREKSRQHHRWLRSSSKFSLKQSRRESIALCERRFEDYPAAGRRVELRKISTIKGSPSFDVVSSSLLSSLRSRWKSHGELLEERLTSYSSSDYDGNGADSDGDGDGHGGSSGGGGGDGDGGGGGDGGDGGEFETKMIYNCLPY
ncbi:transcription factor Sp9 [Vespula maculifrons]|uniref:Transcription factor Sp9 n=1 Tax=Vespula maculifrons TaxID=7453 RepID=A0ABD2CA54_VESMC